MRKLFIFLIFIMLSFCIFPQSEVFAEEKDLSSYSQKDYKEFNITNENEFYCINKNTNQIEFYNNGEITTFGIYGENPGEFTEVKFFKTLKNNELVVLDSLNKLHFFSNNFNYIKTISTISNNNTLLPLGNITSIFSDIYSNVYLIDSTNNFILKTNSSESNFSVYNTFNILPEKAILLTNENLVFLHNNTLIKNEQQININSNCLNIFSDALNNIYAICENLLIKYNSNFEFQKQISVNINSYFSINLETGTIYYFENNTINKLESFADNTLNFNHPINALDKIALTEEASIKQTNQKCKLLNSPYSTESLLEVNEKEKLIILSENYNSNLDFSYVLYSLNNTNYIGYIENKYLTTVTPSELAIRFYPVRDNIKAYKYPNNSSDFMLEDNYFPSNQNYLVAREIKLDNITYYQIELDNKFLYVLNYEFISDIHHISNYLTPNARINFYNNVEEIKLYKNENKSEVLCSVTTPTDVKIIEKKGNITQIQILYNNELTTCFIETKYIVATNPFIVPLTIILSFICLIVLTMLIIKFSKKKQN